MDDVQNEIELFQVEVRNANAAIVKAVRERRARGKDSPLTANLNTAVETARAALAAVEIKLRAVYERKGGD